ncbi:MAG: S41 family peptidase [Flavobacteriaceae bacterium]|nr:S41 family peptidase [Flavobacteriaceae bacterium]
MTKKTKIYLPLLLSIAIAIGIFIGSSLDYKKKTITFFGGTPQENKIKRLINFIQYEYVDEVDTDSLLDGTIKNMLKKLDPHSVYIPAKEQEGIAETMNGKFVGIGIQFRMYKDSLTVIKVLKNGPSEKAGLKAGDRILIANKDTLYGKNINSDYILKTLKGKPNTQVNLNIYRKSENKSILFTIIRGDVPIKSVDAFYMINDNLGYIKINKFAATTYDEFKEALDLLLEEGMKKLVLDLRHNPGGYLQVATEIIDEFLEDKKLIVFTKNKGLKIDNTYATSKGDFEDGHVFVLINGASASASEIVAGALQDNDKGTIVGRRSFGKGLVQQEMNLGDGSAVRLTVSRYYTPTGRSIQKPYNHSGNDEYFNEFEKRYIHGELMSIDSIKVVDSLKFVTPKGKIVYGGGGIIPDVFVSIDTTNYFNRGHYRSLNDFVFSYTDIYRSDFKDITLNYFLEKYYKNHELFEKYLKSIPKVHLGLNLKVTPLEKQSINTYLKALFVRELFNDNTFYKVFNKHDKMLEEVIRLDRRLSY